MNAPFEFTIGSQVVCSDGVCGELKRVVVDPYAHALTHLVVEPRFRHGGGRLVPVDLVEPGENEVRLRATKAEFDQLEEAQETHYLSGANGDWNYEQEHMLSLPYYQLAADGTNLGASPIEISRHRVPPGEVEVHRGETVHATDGVIGRVEGLVIDPGDDHVSHVLLDEGHLWGTKRVAIPIGAVKGAGDGVQLALTKDQVRDLPEAELEPQARRRSTAQGSSKPGGQV
jgi:sporulation protein YlmC with PRC-barrel domain